MTSMPHSFWPFWALKWPKRPQKWPQNGQIPDPARFAPNFQDKSLKIDSSLAALAAALRAWLAGSLQFSDFCLENWGQIARGSGICPCWGHVWGLLAILGLKMAKNCGTWRSCPKNDLKILGYFWGMGQCPTVFGQKWPKTGHFGAILAHFWGQNGQFWPGLGPRSGQGGQIEEIWPAWPRLRGRGLVGGPASKILRILLDFRWKIWIIFGQIFLAKIQKFQNLRILKFLGSDFGSG